MLIRAVSSLDFSWVLKHCVGSASGLVKAVTMFLMSLPPVQVQDGRRSHKDMEKASSKKLDSQLRSIRDMKGNVGGRKVDFGRFDGAFGGSKGGEDLSVAATPSRKRIKL